MKLFTFALGIVGLTVLGGLYAAGAFDVNLLAWMPLLKPLLG